MIKGRPGMRLWSVHPQYLDRQGLVAGWREALLAQAVLAGRTTGYRHHPQLRRFAEQDDPVASVVAYLNGLAAEAERRGYRFDRSRVDQPAGAGLVPSIPVTDGQIDHEWRHLRVKVERRNPHLLAQLDATAPVRPHPSFHVVAGPVEEWEVREHS
jgi:hypothetical protein